MWLQGEGLAYQWYKDGAALATETAGAPRLLISSPGVEDCGFYYVAVSNEAGRVQSTQVHVIVKPEALKPLRPDALQTTPPWTTVAPVASPGRAGRAAARRRKMLAGQLQPQDAAASPESSAPMPEYKYDRPYAVSV